MKSGSKKQRVLTLLQQQPKAMSLPKLLEVLGPEFAERSVRRWLSELASEGFVKKTGEKRSTRYQTIVHTVSSLFTPDSQKSIAYVRQPIFRRDPVTYNKNWLDNYQPNQTNYLSKKTSETLFKEGQRYTNQDPAGTYARKIYNRLLIDLSYNSSRLEGNTYSLLETKKLVLEGINNQNKLDEEKIMILNHKEAIRHLVDNADQLKIDPTEIRTLHYLLSDGLVPVNCSGKLRDHGVRIGASTYVPIENPMELKKQLERICNKASKIKDPYEKSFFLLVHLAYLQAFTDVNKRTSRLSANIPLIKNNLVPLSFNDIDKEDYISAMLSIYELNDPSPLMDLYCFSYFRTCQLYDTTIESLSFDAIRVRFRRVRRHLIREIISKEITGKKLEAYIHDQTNQHIPEEYREAFKENVVEDLNVLSPERIVGMGITEAQLKKWQRLYRT